jgi:septum formation protein
VVTKLVLASASPRRRRLLIAAGFEFESVRSAIGEKFDSNLTLRELTAYNATRKGISVARRYPQKVVLAADTLVALENEVIGKPADMREAVEILRRLSGRVHEVCTAVFICHSAEKRAVTFCEKSSVRFRRLTSNMIHDYLTRINPLDKAGAYAAQGAGAEIIARIDGSFTNVVGLPMERTAIELRGFGIEPRSN